MQVTLHFALSCFIKFKDTAKAAHVEAVLLSLLFNVCCAGYTAVKEHADKTSARYTIWLSEGHSSYTMKSTISPGAPPTDRPPDDQLGMEKILAGCQSQKRS